jgi:hypothetical protein
MGTSLTRRDRNSDLRILTAHDIEGFAEHDWRALARPGAVAAIYMGQARRALPARAAADARRRRGHAGHGGRECQPPRPAHPAFAGSTAWPPIWPRPPAGPVSCCWGWPRARRQRPCPAGRSMPDEPALPQLQVVTANALISGQVVWLTASEAGRRACAARRSSTTREAEAALARAQAQDRPVVGCLSGPGPADAPGPRARAFPRSLPPRRPLARRAHPELRSHVSLRRLRPRLPGRAQPPVPRPGRPPARRLADRGGVPPAAADERPLSATPRLHAARGHPLWHAEPRPAAQAGRCRRALGPRLWPFHHPPEHPVQLAAS